MGLLDALHSGDIHPITLAIPAYILVALFNLFVCWKLAEAKGRSTKLAAALSIAPYFVLLPYISWLATVYYAGMPEKK